jgi:two-component system response regulator PhoP
MRVLLVEDEVRLAENIGSALRENLQCSVDLAEDGETALSCAQRQTYDVVVLDLMLPGMCGIDFLTRLREAKSRVPVLILTANHDKASVIRSFEAGADDYMGKPFDLAELLTRINALAVESSNELLRSRSF